MSDLTNLPTCNENGDVHVVVEAPRGSLVKLKFEPLLRTWVFQRALPLGVAYPYDWGFIPSTTAADGDPLDAMVLSDVATWPGVVIETSPIGAVSMVQRDGKGEAEIRNDRIILVPRRDRRYEDVRDISKRMREELEQFFVTAIEMTGKSVKIEGWKSAKAAQRAIRKASGRYERGAGRR
ncbi:MAG TPA: inorganic diphosphatase [Candidatus Binatia bacterium]